MVAYAEEARGLSAHLHDSGPWAFGGKEPITPGHRARVTTMLLQFTFRNSEVTSPCLTLCSYSLLREQGHGGIGFPPPLHPRIEPGSSRLWAKHAFIASQRPLWYFNVCCHHINILMVHQAFLKETVWWECLKKKLPNISINFPSYSCVFWSFVYNEFHINKLWHFPRPPPLSDLSCFALPCAHIFFFFFFFSFLSLSLPWIYRKPRTGGILWCNGSTLGSQPRVPRFEPHAKWKNLGVFSDISMPLFTYQRIGTWCQARSCDLAVAEGKLW